MNELNSLEARLASWKPRRPSAQVAANLFAKRHRQADEAASPPWLGWFLDLRHVAWTTAAVCGLALLCMAGNRAEWLRRVRGAGEDGLAVLAALSNQSASAYVAAVQITHNTWSAPILGWTNRGHIPSTNRSLDPLTTNQLLPRL